MKDVANAKKHLNEHQSYPATKEELVAECDGLKDFSEEDKKWYEAKLTEKTYNSADEVIETLGL